MNGKTAKRFYSKAQAASIDGGDGGYTVELDGRAVKTPQGHALAVPSRALADALAAEWDAQEDTIVPDSMPLSQLAITALDRMVSSREDVVFNLAAYGGSDLLCYRADAPQDLVAREAKAWQPLLDWADETFGAPLNVTNGILPIEQPALSLVALQGAIEELDPMALAVLGSVVPLSGSLILGLALVQGRLDAEEVVEAAFVDETYQAEKWGEDKEATERYQAISADIRTAEQFLNLVQGMH